MIYAAQSSPGLNTGITLTFFPEGVDYDLFRA